MRLFARPACVRVGGDRSMPRKRKSVLSRLLCSWSGVIHERQPGAMHFCMHVNLSRNAARHLDMVSCEQGRVAVKRTHRWLPPTLQP